MVTDSYVVLLRHAGQRLGAGFLINRRCRDRSTLPATSAAPRDGIDVCVGTTSIGAQVEEIAVEYEWR